jgi:hypothetical protein
MITGEEFISLAGKLASRPDADEAGTNRNAKECVEESHRVRSAILACREEPAFSQIKADIAAYEKKIGG